MYNYSCTHFINTLCNFLKRVYRNLAKINPRWSTLHQQVAAAHVII